MPSPLKIFVSSTIQDMKSEREAARRSIIKLQQIPVMSESTFGAEDKSSKQVIIEKVVSSDVYVLILGNRFGYEFEEGLSVTKLEWNTAVANDKPRFVFNMADRKESKQEEFAKVVGNFEDGRFYKTCQTVFELGDEIEKALKNHLSEKQNLKSGTQETLTTNLLQLSFPENLFTASYKTEKEKKWNTNDKRFIEGRLQDLRRSQQIKLQIYDDWIAKEGKIFSFRDLNDSALEIHHLCEIETIEKNPITILQSDEKHRRYFSELLQSCLREKLYRLFVDWDNGDKYFYFAASPELTAISIEWKGPKGKKAKREVFSGKGKKEDGSGNPSDYRHFAFRSHFHFVQNEWHLSIKPTWHFTTDGIHKSNFSGDRVSNLKRVENNKTVYYHTEFWMWFLMSYEDDDMFAMNESHEKYPYIEFKKPQKLNPIDGINDEMWKKNDEENNSIAGQEELNFEDNED